MRFLLYTRYYTINITSFHIFASTASGDIISLYAKMLKSTAYFQPCSVRQQKTLPLRQEGVPEGGGSVSLLQSSFHETLFYVLFHFLAVKSGAKSGAMINFRGQPPKFPKTDASHF